MSDTYFVSSVCVERSAPSTHSSLVHKSGPLARHTLSVPGNQEACMIYYFTRFLLLSTEWESVLTAKDLSEEHVSKTAPQCPTPSLVAVKAVAVSSPAISYSTLPSFSWEQDSDKVKIYLSLQGVQEEKMETNIKQMSVVLKMHDVQGTNYQFVIPKLNKEIVPEKCKVLVKPTRVIITLVRALQRMIKPSVDKEKDHMAGNMDLMKNMYEEGEEEMKKTIAKAWTDSRSGKTAAPLKGFR